MIVYDKLWETMSDRGIAPYALRDKHGFDNNTIRRLKANENVTIETIDKLCRVLDCNVEDILTYIKD